MKSDNLLFMANVLIKRASTALAFALEHARLDKDWVLAADINRRLEALKAASTHGTMSTGDIHGEHGTENRDSGDDSAGGP